MSKTDDRLQQPMVPADPGDSVSRPGEKGPLVPADVPLAELLEEIARRVKRSAAREAKIYRDVRDNRGAEFQRGRRAALLELNYWLRDRKTASGTGGNDPNSATPRERASDAN